MPGLTFTQLFCLGDNGIGINIMAVESPIQSSEGINEWWYAYETSEGQFGDYSVPELKTYMEGSDLILDLTDVTLSKSFAFGSIVNEDVFNSG